MAKKKKFDKVKKIVKDPDTIIGKKNKPKPAMNFNSSFKRHPMNLIHQSYLKTSKD